MAVWELVRDAVQIAHGRGRQWLTAGEITREALAMDPTLNRATIQAYVRYLCINDPSKKHSPGHPYRRNPLFITDDPSVHGKRYRLLTEEERKAFLSSPRDDLEGVTYQKLAQWLKCPTEALLPESIPPHAVTARRRRRSGRDITLRRMQDRVDHLIADFAQYVEAFAKANPFTGPSWHFHHKTLAVLRQHRRPCEALDCDEFFEYLYATLTAWGLHRMGPRGAKLLDLSEIRETFIGQKEAIRDVQSLSIISIATAELPAIVSKLWTILRSLRVGAGETKIVANSKALHHLLPHLVPPIDRAYTLRFFYNNTALNQGDEVAFGEIYPCFHRIALARQEQIRGHIGRRPWNTSQTKVIDNAIVGFVVKHLR
jgi:hypothetical protein